jgi:hypothetical protein
MNMDAELNRLAAMYVENDDDELLQMYERREDLTDLAQEALAKVMKERGVVPVEHVGEPVDAAELVEEGDLSQGEVGIWQFDDMFQAQTAMQVLTSAEIDHRMIDRSQRNTDGLRGRYLPAMLLVVDESDRARTEQVLRQRMKLFPLPEVDSAREGVEGEAGEFVLLSMFERKDALVAARELGAAGISYKWRDGRDAAEEQPDEETVTLEVKVADMERAAGIVDAGLGE